jgi:xanthine dehydrogenase YagS FAD-binding subunit
LKTFAHVDVKSIADASTALGAGNAVLIAGGTDLLGRLKDNVLPSYPATVVNIKTIPNLNYINQDSSGLKIGALAFIEDIANSSTVKGTWPALSTAAASVASPHVRAMGTLGGNLAQHVRCWYYRVPNNRFNCIRKGGNTCFAASGDNRYHSIYGAPKGCNSVYPSDTATALMALNASIVTNKRSIGIESFFDALTGTVLGSGELITEVDVPTPPAGSNQSFTKFRLRKAVDFAILSVATMLTMSGSTCTAARIALGGVAPTPLRSTAAESAIVGKTLDANAAAAAASAAVGLATPLQYNVYKVPILKTLITRALTPAS